MLRVQSPQIGDALRDTLDLSAQGGVAMTMRTDIVPVILVGDTSQPQANQTQVHVMGGAFYLAATHAWWQCRAGTVPLAIVAVEIASVGNYAFLIGAFVTPLGTPANNSYMYQTDMRNLSVASPAPGGALIYMAEQGAPTEALYSSRQYVGANGSVHVEPPAPWYLPPGGCLEVVGVSAGSQGAVTFYGYELPQDV